MVKLHGIHTRTQLYRLVFFLITVFGSGQVSAITTTLGWQNFSDGDVISGNTYNAYQYGETGAFNGFIGSDPSGPSFSESWTFNYAAGSYTDANIEFALYDYDCFTVNCDVVSTFTVDGFDFTSALNSQMLPGSSQLYSIFLIDLSSIASALDDGSATVSLTLQPDVNSTQNFNGAGLDFSTLTLASPVPVPAAIWLFGSGLIGLIGVARRKKA